MAKQLTETEIITNRVRFSYANVFEPKSVDGGDPKYSVCLLIDKNDKEALDLVIKSIEVAKKAGAGLWGGKIPAILKLPLRDGDVEKPGDPVYSGHYFINASSKNQPGIVKKGPDGKAVKIGRDEFYSGCYGFANVNFYPFKQKSNGVACGLNNLMKTEDGEKLAGARSAADAFGLDEEGNEFM